MSPIWPANIFHTYIYSYIHVYIYHVKSQGNEWLQGFTVSSCYWQVLCILVRLQAWAWYDNTCQIQPVQRDRMPSGPTKYMSVFKYNHLEWKEMQHTWMHRTTCHHYGCTWPSNKSYHQQQPHTNWHVLNECSYRKIFKKFPFSWFFFEIFKKISIFVEMFEKSLFSEKNHRHHLKQCRTQCHMDVSVSSSYFMTSVLLFTYRWKQWLLMTCYPTKIVSRAICNSLRSWHITVYFSLYNSWKTPTHSSPIRARYAVSFVCANLTKVLSL